MVNWATFEFQYLINSCQIIKIRKLRILELKAAIQLIKKCRMKFIFCLYCSKHNNQL